MSKRFIVAVDNLRDPQGPQRNQQFIGYAKGGKMAWWSWVPSLWLVADASGEMTAERLSNDARDIFNAPCLVIELQKEGEWAGYGPKEMFQWMHDSWDLLRHPPEGIDLRDITPHPRSPEQKRLGQYILEAAAKRSDEQRR